jgi:hypothetical protein
MEGRPNVITSARSLIGKDRASALAGDTYQHHAHKSKIERYSDPQLSEGRNSSHWSGYLTNVSSDRESMVETLGN